MWNETVELGRRHGYRNGQASVLAPTGTIGLMMDCDTTGVEPDLALVKYKKLVGGGLMKIVNQTVPSALKRASAIESEEVDAIVDYVHENGYIERAPYVSATSTYPCSTARSRRRVATVPSTTWDT